MSTQLKPFLKNIANTIRAKQVCNIYDSVNYPMKAGYYIHADNGGYNSSTAHCATPDYIPCDKYRNMEITIPHTTSSGSSGVAFYDVKKTFISGVKVDSSTVIKTIIPNNACFYRFSIAIENIDYALIEVTNSNLIPAQTFSSEINNLYEIARDDEETLTWSMITGKGSRTNYIRAFNCCDFSGKTVPEWFLPTAPSYQLFYSYYGDELPLGIDLSNIQETSTNATAVTTYALYSWATTIKRIYDMGLPAYNSYTSTYSHCRALEEIEIIRVNENTTFSSTFSNCNALHTVHFEGTIGKSINFAQSPLSINTMKHIIEHLKDYSQDTTNINTQTLTFTDDCWTALEASGVSPLGGTWREYVQSLGWNV